MIFQRLLYETLVFRPNNEQTSIVADIDADGLWLKRLHFICIKSPKVICRAVHDATLNNTTRELNVLLYCFTSLLQIQIIKERRSRRDVWLMPELKHPKDVSVLTPGIVILPYSLKSPNCSGWTMVSAKCAPAHESEASFKLGNLVEPGGIEPPTSCVQGRLSPS